MSGKWFVGDPGVMGVMAFGVFRIEHLSSEKLQLRVIKNYRSHPTGR